MEFNEPINSRLSRDEQLHSLYKTRWGELIAAIPTGIGMSAPLLVKVPPGYDNCQIKLAVVGQETHGWGNWNGGDDPAEIEKLRQKYAEFARGKHFTRSPFFQAAYRLQALLNPASDRYDFAWLNLFPADQYQDLPSVAVADKLRAVNLLHDELSILQPDAVVFFTGPVYDYTIKKLFPDAEFSHHGPRVEIVRAKGLPQATVRTYHPNFLRRKREFGVIDVIAKWITKNDPDRASDF